MKRKVLWLCHVQFSEDNIKQTGSWLQPLAELLVSSGSIEIGVIAPGTGNTIIKTEVNGIHQWLIPIKNTSGYGQCATKETSRIVSDIINDYCPDIVHIWGTESIWASIYANGYINCKTIIDIQGLLYDYSFYYYGQMSFIEIIKSFHLKEMIMPWRSLPYKKYIFKKRGTFEQQYLSSFANISTQSQWVRDHLRFTFPNAKLFKTRILLRNQFYTCSQWQYREVSDSPVIFSTCSAAVTYKGMHTAIKALSVLVNKYPNIKLRLAGRIDVGGKLLDGYSIFLRKLIKKYKLEDNVEYLGSIDALEIIHQLQDCNVCLIPSFIETYCLAFAESMIVGVPTVVSYAGAMPEQAKDEEEALFYNPFDYVTAAAHIDRIVSNKSLSEKLSYNARKRKFIDNDPQKVVNTQIEIYNNICNNGND